MTQDEKNEALKTLNVASMKLVQEQLASLVVTLERVINTQESHAALLTEILAEAVRENTDPTGSLDRVEKRLAGMMETVRATPPSTAAVAASKGNHELLASQRAVAMATLERDLRRSVSGARDILAGGSS